MKLAVAVMLFTKNASKMMEKHDNNGDTDNVDVDDDEKKNTQEIKTNKQYSSNIYYHI